MAKIWHHSILGLLEKINGSYHYLVAHVNKKLEEAKCTLDLFGKSMIMNFSVTFSWSMTKQGSRADFIAILGFSWRL